MSIQGVSQLGEMLEAQGGGLGNRGVQEGGCELFIGQIQKVRRASLRGQAA